MRAKEQSNPTKSKIQRTRDAIRRSWSPEERSQRRRLAEAKQQWLFNALFTQEAVVPARVA